MRGVIAIKPFSKKASGFPQKMRPTFAVSEPNKKLLVGYTPMHRTGRRDRPEHKFARTI
jgi:hypothetical protein